MTRRNVVVMGGSAGAIETLRTILPKIPADFDASIFVVVHAAEGDGRDGLAGVLSRHVALPCEYAQDNEAITPRRIYVARPGRHMILAGRRVRIADGPRENGFRPAIDPLFRTAAMHHGARVVGVVLSGARDDGAQGLAAIDDAGGATIVQLPSDATFPEMPTAAMRHVDVDDIVPASEIAGAIERRCAENVIEDAERARPVGTTEIDDPRTRTWDAFLCPDCGGVLRDLRDEPTDRFQCRTGHAHSLESLLAHQAEGVEAALWAAVNVLKEREDMANRLGARAADRGLRFAAKRYRRDAEESASQARLITDLLRDVRSLAAKAGVDEDDDESA